MKNNLYKGDFITHKRIPGSFAIYGGETLGVDSCGNRQHFLQGYYNPAYASKGQTGNWRVAEVLDVETTDVKCKFTLSDGDLLWWRNMTQAEVDKALAAIEKKYNYVYDSTKCIFRKKGVSFTRTPSRQSASVVPIRTNTASPKTTVEFKVARVIPEDFVQTNKIKGFDIISYKALNDFAKKEAKKPCTAAYTGGSYTPFYSRHGQMSIYGNYYDDEYDDYWG